MKRVLATFFLALLAGAALAQGTMGFQTNRDSTSGAYSTEVKRDSAGNQYIEQNGKRMYMTQLPGNASDTAQKQFIFSARPIGKVNQDSLARALSENTDRSGALLMGKSAPDSSLTLYDGTRLNLANPEGKVTVLCFWFIACKPCVAEMPMLNQMVAAYAGQQVRFIGPAADGIPKLKEFFRQKAFSYSVLPNATQLAANRFGVTAYPTHIVIDRKGIVRHVQVGSLNDAGLQRLRAAIDRLLAE